MGKYKKIQDLIDAGQDTIARSDMGATVFNTAAHRIVTYADGIRDLNWKPDGGNFGDGYDEITKVPTQSTINQTLYTQMDELSRKLTGAYVIKGSVQDKATLLTLKGIQKGWVYNMQTACILNGVHYDAYNNYVYTGADKGTNDLTTEADWDSLGPVTNMDDLINRISTLGGVVYANHMNNNSITVSQNPIEKGIQSPAINLTWKAQLDGLDINKFTFTYKISGGTSITGTYADMTKSADNKYYQKITTLTKGSVSNTNNTTFNFDVTFGGATVTKSVTIYPKYPVYYYVSTDGTVANIPKDVSKWVRRTANSVQMNPSGNWTITTTAGAQYIYFCVPDDMSINDVKMNNASFGPFTDGTIATTTKGTYKIYRTKNTFDPGTYTVQVS